MSAHILLLALGGLLIVVAILGGGIQARELTIPQIGKWPRVLARQLLMPVLVCAVFLSAHSRGEAQTQTIRFASDPTWAVADSAGAAKGFAQYVCLNGSAPSNCPAGATLYGYTGPGWAADLSAIPGARWIWAAGIRSTTAPAYPAEFTFSKAFILSGTPSVGTFRVSADDFAEVRVNGVLAGTVGSRTDISLAAASASSLTTFNILPLLRPGVNEISVRAANGPYGCGNGEYRCNPAGVVFGGVLESVLNLPAPSGSCTNGTASGTYGYRMAGAIVGTGPFLVNGLFTHNPDGTMSGKVHLTINGQQLPDTAWKDGKFKTNADCTGSGEFIVEALQLKITYNFIATDGGRQIELLNTNPGILLHGVGRRIADSGRAPSCTDGTILGAYGYRLDGSIPNAPMTAFAGTINHALDANLKGVMSGSDTAGFMGQFVPRGIQGTYKLNGDCTGTGRYKDTIGNDINYTFTVVNGGREIYLQGTDPGVNVSGVARRVQQ